jgi:uncharacterized membrane protein (UPF0127 family)
VEIAATEASRRTGLMFREQLPANGGMLFLWPDTARRGMWMKNTRIPLDVAFINDDQVIVNIETMAPHTTRLHTSTQPVRWALEVNAGWFARHGVVPGQRIPDLEAALARVGERTEHMR